MTSALLQLLLLQCAAASILASVSAADSPASAAWSADDIYSNGGDEEDGRDAGLAVATEEMRRANYFTFVMLLNMVVNGDDKDRTAANVTFLMPNDRILSNITFTTQNHDEGDASSSNGTTTTNTWSVRAFMLRHSIPSPLLFDHLWHFPSGSTIPSSYPGYALQVQNDDNDEQQGGKWWRRRGNFSLNNVKIISPNICTSPSSSIRCHGIDGVLSPALIPPPPPVYYCAPKPAPAPSDHDKLAPNSAPSSNHFDYVGPGAETQPPSSHSPASHTPAATHSAAAAGVGLRPGPGYQLLLSLIVLLWRWD